MFNYVVSIIFVVVLYCWTCVNYVVKIVVVELCCWCWGRMWFNDIFFVFRCSKWF